VCARRSDGCISGVGCPQIGLGRSKGFGAKAPPGGDRAGRCEGGGSIAVTLAGAGPDEGADDALVDKYNFFIFENVKAHVANLLPGVMWAKCRFRWERQRYRLWCVAVPGSLLRRTAIQG
jgi:hypothetical protein